MYSPWHHAHGVDDSCGGPRHPRLRKQGAETVCEADECQRDEPVEQQQHAGRGVAEGVHPHQRTEQARECHVAEVGDGP